MVFDAIISFLAGEWVDGLQELSASAWGSRKVNQRTGREPVMRISTSLCALRCQSRLAETLATPTMAQRRSIGSKSLRMSPLLVARRTSARSAVLGLSLYTVETHRANILEKLNLRGTPELILYAVRKEVIS